VSLTQRKARRGGAGKVMAVLGRDKGNRVNTELKLRKRMRMRETKVMERFQTPKPKPGLPEPKQKLPPWPTPC